MILQLVKARTEISTIALAMRVCSLVLRIRFYDVSLILFKLLCHTDQVERRVISFKDTTDIPTHLSSF